MLTNKKYFVVTLILFLFTIQIFAQDIFQSAYNGDITQVKLLLERNPELLDSKDTNGLPLLTYSSSQGHIKIVEFLVSKGADINVSSNSGNTPLTNAANGGHKDVVEFLISKGANIHASNNDGNSSIFQAAVNGHNDVVALFIDKGIDVNAQKDDGYTLLHQATLNGHIKTINFLLTKGASINVRDESGITPLFFAIWRGYQDIAELMITNGAEVNSKETNTGKTPLHMAVIRGYNRNVNSLITKGANIGALDDHNKTPLDYAVKYRNQKAVDMLLLKINIANDVKKSVSMMKQEFNNQETGIWYLGHSGWGVKTGDDFLIFDYWNPGNNPDEPSLGNGYINPSDIQDLNVYVFVSHEHADHFDTCIFKWKEQCENITYIFGFQPENVPPYEFISPRETREIDGLKITTIESNDSGVGFLVEVNGLTIFHAGDHANRYRDFSGSFCAEIDYLSDMKGKIDIAFLPIAGCNFGDQVAVKKGIYYTLDKLSPKFMFPMHAGNYLCKINQEFAEAAEAKNFITQIISAENRGDRFLFKNGYIKVVD